ncbi:response regulator transcription factor [Bacteriovorax sp. DB6_IX]|uniref:response regulator transcription factor n=1 Tax=Bacteriovorax sp. DB6_IX TaxID=1353530 RepID=UPI000389DD4B|nr:response regulator [Bacteriovorax sp. DB6_IX]EQC44136.1 response regulator receiver domain protein [Bacteriovorax sp. DB6_IX]
MKLLIVEDDYNYARMLQIEFEEAGDDVKVLNDPELVLEETEEYGHIILDLRVETKSSINYVADIRKKYPEAKIFILTGFGSISTTVEAIKLGADDYLTKPISFDVLRAALLGEKEKVTEVISEEGLSLDRNEREYIEFVLQKCGGNITKAAKTLGIHRQSLQRKLKKYTPKS